MNSRYYRMRIKQAFAEINKPLAHLYDRSCVYRPVVNEVIPIEQKEVSFVCGINTSPDYNFDTLKALFVQLCKFEKIYFNNIFSKEEEFAELTINLKVLFRKASKCYIFPFANPNSPEAYLDAILEKFKDSVKLLEQKKAPKPSPPRVVLKKIEPPSPRTPPQESQVKGFSFVPKSERVKSATVQQASPYLKYQPTRCLDFLQSVQDCLQITKDKAYYKQAERELKEIVNRICNTEPTKYTREIIQLFQRQIGQVQGEEKETVAYFLWILLLEKFYNQSDNQFYHEINSAIGSGRVVKELLMVYPDKELFVLSLLTKHCPLLFSFSCQSPEDSAIIDDFIEEGEDSEEFIASIKGMSRFFASICVTPNKNAAFSLILSVNLIPVVIGGVMNRFRETASAEAISAILDVSGDHVVQLYRPYGTKLLKSIKNKIETNKHLRQLPSENCLLTCIRSLMIDYNL